MDRNRDPGQPQRRPALPDDQADLDRARHRLQEAGVATIAADEEIAGVLAPGECVVTIRRGVVLERRSPAAHPRGGLRGDLYVTNRRLIHLGPIRLEYVLSTISEAIVAGRLVLLRLDHRGGITFEVDDPVLLRRQIAAARAGRADPTTGSEAQVVR